MRDCQARAASLTALQQRPTGSRRGCLDRPHAREGQTMRVWGSSLSPISSCLRWMQAPTGHVGQRSLRNEVHQSRRRGQTRRRYPPAHLVQRPGRDPGIPVSSKIGQPRSRATGVAFRHVDNEFPSETTSRRYDISPDRRCTMTGFALRTQSMRPIPRTAVFWKHANGICARRGQQAAAVVLVEMPVRMPVQVPAPSCRVIPMYSPARLPGFVALRNVSGPGQTAAMGRRASPPRAPSRRMRRARRAALRRRAPEPRRCKEKP